MNRLWKNFPVFLGLTFIVAASHVDILRQIGTVARWGILVMGIFLGIKSSFRTDSTLRRHVVGFDIGAIVFIGTCFASSFWSIVPGYTIFRSVSILLLYLCSFWSLWKWTDEFGELQLQNQLILVVGWGLVLNLLLGLTMVPGAFLVGRFRGLLENPNTVAILSGLFIPLLFFRFLQRTCFLNFLFLIATCLGLILSGGRAGLLAAIVGVGLVLWKRSSFLRSILVALGISLIALFELMHPGVILEFAQGQIYRGDADNLLSNRQVAWDLANYYIAQRPVLGHGFGTDGLLHQYYRSQVSVRIHGVASAYYGMAVQFGVYLTVIFFAGLWLFALRALIAGMRDNPLIVVYSAIMIGGLMICFTEPWIYSAGNAYSWFYWTIIMLLVRRIVTDVPIKSSLTTEV